MKKSLENTKFFKDTVRRLAFPGVNLSANVRYAAKLWLSLETRNQQRIRRHRGAEQERKYVQCVEVGVSPF